MKTISNLQQGSDEWKGHRAKHNNASEASAMMGVSPHTTRSELVRMVATGDEKEFSDYVQRYILDKGHENEAFARKLLEKALGEELFPVTVVDDEGWLSASLDGITMDESKIFECKTLSKEKLDYVERDECPPQDYPQVQQQLLITGADVCLYTLSDGTQEGTVVLDVKPDADFQNKLCVAWGQFEEDVKNYVPREPEPVLEKATFKSIPSLSIQVEGKVLSSNLDRFKQHAYEALESVNTDLQTDQDFADAAEAVKWCEVVEKRIASQKESILGQTATIDEAFNVLDDVSERAREIRLMLNRLVTDRKKQRRSEIKAQAVSALDEHCKTINETLTHGIRLDVPQTSAMDVAAAMKGKRTITSLMDSAEQALADAKLRLNERADQVRANLKQYDELAGDYQHLFADLSLLVEKPTDDFINTVKLRIAEHKQAEAEKAERERERIREEERRRLEQEEIDRLAQKQSEEEANAAATENRQGEAAGEEPSNPEPPPSKPDIVEADEKSQTLTEYQQGYIDGLTAFAWWKDGTQMVGTTGTTLQKAVDQFLQQSPGA